MWNNINNTLLNNIYNTISYFLCIEQMVKMIEQRELGFDFQKSQLANQSTRSYWFRYEILTTCTKISQNSSLLFLIYHPYLFLINIFLFKVLVVSVLNMAQLNIGLGLGFSSISVPDLELEQSEIHFNKVEISWFGKN